MSDLLGILDKGKRDVLDAAVAPGELEGDIGNDVGVAGV